MESDEGVGSANIYCAPTMMQALGWVSFLYVITLNPYYYKVINIVIPIV